MMIMAKKNEEAKKKRSGHAIALWVPEDLYAELEQWREEQRVAPTRTDVLELALREFLTREREREEKAKAK